MPNLVENLNSLDFSVLIGGPLQAVVEAQQVASISTVKFIREIGFYNDNGVTKVRTVDFTYDKKTGQLNGDGEPIKVSTIVSIPLIAMVPLPSLEISEARIKFNAKLSSVETSDIDTNFGITGNLSIQAKNVEFKVSASYQKNNF